MHGTTESEHRGQNPTRPAELRAQISKLLTEEGSNDRLQQLAGPILACEAICRVIQARDEPFQVKFLKKIDEVCDLDLYLFQHARFLSRLRRLSTDLSADKDIPQP